MIYKTMINRLFQIMFIIQVSAIKEFKPLCNMVSDDGKQCFVKELLTNADHSANQLAVDKKTNTLYFSFDAGQGEFIPAMLNIETKKLKLLKGVKDAFAIASEDKSGYIYFGGSNGIYRYIPLDKKLMKLGLGDLDVWWLAVKKSIYYIQFPTLRAYVYKKKTVKPVKDLKNVVMQQFVFDFQGNIFFINSTGLYGLRKNEKNPVLLRDSPKFFGLAVDNKGLVYVCSEDGVYLIKNEDRYPDVVRVVSIPGVLAITFDKDNHLIYSDSHDLVRLLAMQRRTVQAIPSIIKLQQNDLKAISVCKKVCEVLKMRVTTPKALTTN